MDRKQKMSSSICYLVQQNYDVTLELLRFGLNCSQKDKMLISFFNYRGGYPLHLVCRFGSLRTLILYLNCPSVDINQFGENNWYNIYLLQGLPYMKQSVISSGIFVNF